MSELNEQVEEAIDQLVSSTRLETLNEVSIEIFKMRAATTMAGEHLAYGRALIAIDALRSKLAPKIAPIAPIPLTPDHDILADHNEEGNE